MASGATLSRDSPSIMFIEAKEEVFGGQHALIQRCVYMRDQSDVDFLIVHPFVHSRFYQAAINAGLGNFIRNPLKIKPRKSYFVGLLALAIYLIRAKPRIIHLDGFDSCYLACLFKTVGLLKKTGIVFTLRSDRYHRFNFVDVFLLNRVDKLLTNSEYSKREIYKKAGLHALVHYSPINLEFLENKVSALEKSASARGKKRVISYVGALEPRKNLAFFLEVAKALLSKCSDYEFHIYGLAKNRESILYSNGAREKITDDESRSIHFKGYVSIEEAIHATDILLCPFDNEPMGRVVPEFLYCGRDVVVSDSGGLAEAGCGYAKVYCADNLDSCLSVLQRIESVSVDDSSAAMREALAAKFSLYGSVSLDLDIYASMLAGNAD